MGNAHPQPNNVENQNRSLLTSDSYRELQEKVKKAVEIGSNFRDEEGYQLYFRLIPDKEDDILLPLFWKFSISVEVFLVKLEGMKKKHRRSKILNFKEFHKLYYFLLQMHALEESDHTFKANILNNNDLFSDDQSAGAIEECIICMERMPNTVFSCAHAYCQICAKQWCKKSGECPMCRAKIREEDSFHIMETGDSKSEITNILKSFATSK